MTYQLKNSKWIHWLTAGLLALLILPAGFAAGHQVVLADGVTTALTENMPGFLAGEANWGAFEGGSTGTHLDALVDLQVPEKVQTGGGGGFNIPTGAPPSPLNGVQSFTQKLLRFEEFGTVPMQAAGDVTPGMSFPSPMDQQSGPDTVALDAFLDQIAQNMYPYPSEYSNYTDTNPWEQDIEVFLGRNLIHPPAEGRPPGELWSHQRWSEFYPQRYFVTAQAGARTNGGVRDAWQTHHYALGEFGPNGLYHNTVGAPEGQTPDPQFEGTTAGIQIKFHPQWPAQDPNSLWTFDGTLPPKLLKVRYGEPIMMRHYNALPIDPSANKGFGLHTITTHEHNGHNPAESDGYMNAFFFPGQFYDYRWPLQLAGYDTINTRATDRRAGTPDGHGGITRIRGDYRETMSTHWFHDHMLDFTAQNVYKGNAAMMNYYSAIDRGNEAIDDHVNLRFPSGTALDWGNRDYDVNLVVADKAWDANGQLFFNVFNKDGFLGDRVLTNWLYHPTMDVRARRYRFRILNGAVSRYFKFAMVTAAGERVPFYMIANDGNIMEHAVAFPDGVLPTQAIAERYDIIVDFSQFPVGTKIYMVNLLPHKTGKGPESDAVPLADVLSGAYKPVIVKGQWEGGDPAVGKFLEFIVQEYTGTDLSMDPAGYVVGRRKMLPLPRITDQELTNAIHRDFKFGRSNGTDEKPWTVKTDGMLEGFNADPRRLSAAPTVNAGLEIWHISTGGGWDHPVHIHFEEGQILEKDGNLPPPWEMLSRKDVYRIGSGPDTSRSMSIAIRFREFAGTYMEHCHNTQHEDNAMLVRWDVEHPGQTLLLPTPMPTWDGSEFVDSHALPTFRTGQVEDIIPPVITILGANPVTVNLNTVYVDAGATVTDDTDPAPIMTITSTVNTAAVGIYMVTYNASDESGNTSSAVRTVNVADPGAGADTTAPVITLLGANPATVNMNTGYVDAGATVTDDTDPAPTLTITSTVNTAAVGNYTMTYNASDASGNTSSAVRMVNVVDPGPPADNTPPVITILGPNPATVNMNTGYVDAGATVTDDTDPAPTLTITSTVNTAAVGNYTMTYNASDASGNTSSAVRMVNVVDPGPPADNTAPVITVSDVGPVEATGLLTPVNIAASASATDQVGVVSFTASDNGPFLVGATQVTWTAMDAAGNTATAIQNVTVADSTAPVLSVPADVTVGATGPTAVVIGTATATDAVGPVTITNDAPGLFPIGSTIVSWTATDGFGNSALGQQTVTVNDTTPPPPSVENCSLNRAIYIGGARRDFWSISGTSDTLQGQSVTVYLGSVGATSRVIGATTVSSTGRISLTTRRGSASGDGSVPNSGDSQVWIETSLGCTASANIRRIGR